MKKFHLLVATALAIGLTALAVTSVMMLTSTIESTTEEKTEDPEDTNDTTTPSKKENIIPLHLIIIHPYNYKDKEITLKSYYQGDIHASEWSHWIKEGEKRLYIKLKTSDSRPELIMYAQYYFTGTLRFTQNDSTADYYLDETDIQGISELPTKPFYTLEEVETHAYQLLDQQITIKIVFSETLFKGYFSDYETYELLENAEYYVRGSPYVENQYGFPYMKIRIIGIEPVL